MLGSIHERLNEIKVYNAVGMSPRHISLSFLMESLTYAIPAAMLGYLSGMICTNTLLNLKLYPKGLYPNFSSLVTIIVLILVILLILSSSLYPSILVSRYAVPSLQRRWKITKPQGDIWEITLPFTFVSEDEAVGILAFFEEFFSGYSSERGGVFIVEKIWLTKDKTRPIIQLNADMRLPPYDSGLRQEASILANFKEKSFTLILKKSIGYKDIWISSNKRFIDLIRKQFLIWRALPYKTKELYLKRASSLKFEGDDCYED
jgi:hypothetical protein